VNALDLIKSFLPKRFAPSTRAALTVKDVADDGVVTPAKGQLRAVLRLPGEAIDGTANVAALQRLAAAINTGAGRTTLLAWGKPHTLARQLEDRQNRVAAQKEGSGRQELAISQHAHLTAMTQGRGPTPMRPARGPVRRHGFYLIVEGRTREELDRLTDDLIVLYGAVRVRGQEAIAIEADIWRGVPLPPRDVQLWQTASDRRDVEMYLGPGGAHVRQVDPETGRKLRELP
jgi:hypothetical protein